MQTKLVGKYFSYLAKNFPVMCTSGVFQLMPPVSDAAKYLDSYDDLSSKGIAKHVDKLRRFQKEFTEATARAGTVQERSVGEALCLSVSCVLAELDIIRTWEKSPALYLQVAFIGLEQATILPSKTERLREKRLTKRLKAVPSFLALAQANIESVSTSERALAQTMVRDCARSLSALGESDLGKVGKRPRMLADCMVALRDFDRFLATQQEIPDQEGPSFAIMAAEVLGTGKTPHQIYELAKEEFSKRLEILQKIQSDTGVDWQTALAEYDGPAENGMEAQDIVVREIHRLRAFVFETALPSVFTDSSLRIEPQPLHQASTLRPIHYAPALGAWAEEPSRCYVSPLIFTGRGFRDNPTRLKRIKREFVFMVARQSYPGRHLLDSQRRTMGNSPLAQITNPLFTHGWLAFAENMLEELGYLQTQQDRLAYHRRALSRAASAMIDAGLAVGKLDQEACMAILKDTGYSTKEALERLKSIRLSPASRVISTLGLYEMTSLYKDSGLPLDEFCKKLFANGQIPFVSARRIMLG